MKRKGRGVVTFGFPKINVTFELVPLPRIFARSLLPNDFITGEINADGTVTFGLTWFSLVAVDEEESFLDIRRGSA